MDWAVCNFSSRALRESSLIHNTNTKPAIMSDGVCKKADLIAGEVIVTAGVSGPQRGTLSQRFASVWYQGSFLAVRQITLDKPLGKLPRL